MVGYPHQNTYHIYACSNYIAILHRTKMEIIPVIISSLFVILLSALVKFFDKIWWTPIRIQTMMRKQGIRGPSYKLLHGNTKEVSEMRKDALSKSMDISTNHILPRVQPEVATWITLYGAIYLSWQGPKPRLTVMDSEMVKEILNNKSGAFPKSDPTEFGRNLLGDGLVTTNQGEKWTKLRKLANHAFHGDSLKSMIPAIIASTEMMLERWKSSEGRELEVFSEFKLLTAEVISRTAFGSSYLEGKYIFEMLTKLAVLMSRNAFKIRIPVVSKAIKTSDEIESKKLSQAIRDSIIKMISKRENKVMAGEIDSYGDDFLGLLLKSHLDNDTEKRITVDNLVDECKTFYVAGQETTNTLLAWTVFLLAIHPDWQNKAREEVLNVFGQQIPNSDGITKLKIMNMIINETLRLYPPVAGFFRKVTKECKVGNIVLPRNLNVVIPTLAIHHDINIWGKNVHLFKPERFSEGVVKATNNNIAAFLPFGLGPRNCVGMNFASFETKIALSMILQRYSFTLSQSYVHSPCQLLTTRPQHGVQVIVHPVKMLDSKVHLIEEYPNM